MRMMDMGVGNLESHISSSGLGYGVARSERAMESDIYKPKKHPKMKSQKSQHLVPQLNRP